MGFRFSFFRQKRSKEDLELIRFFVKKLGYRPVNVHLFEQAITHRSLTHTGINYSNERLEFLGDAIFDAVIAEFLFDRFKEEDEGYLTKVKSKVVSRKTLSDIGEELEIRQILRYNRGRSINLSSLEGNAFEAIIGALYLDSNYETVRKIILQQIFRKYVDLNKILEEEIDFKSKLFIWSQKRRIKLDFIVLKEENIQGAWNYEIVVEINDTRYGKGTGSSKKLAEQASAKETLELLGEL